MTEKINQELLAACKQALRCIARLTPIPLPTNPDVLNRAINETADQADEVRAKLRAAIEKAENQ